MLELQLIGEADNWHTLDIFEDEGVDLTIPLFPSSDLSERLIDYTDTFDIPATERNLGFLDKAETERFKGRLKNGDEIINGFFSVSNIESYTPDASISVNFISIVKYVVDKMKETPFSYLFKDHTETGANPYITNTGEYINDGSYGFTLDEAGMPHIDTFMSLAVNNQVSDQYSEDDYPVYLMDSEIGSRSAQPTYNLAKLIEAIFDYYDVDVDTNDFLTGTFNYSDCNIKIPTNFRSLSGLSGDESRNVFYFIGDNGWSYNVIANNPNTDMFIIEKNIDIDGIEYKCHTPQENTKYDITATGYRNSYNARIKHNFAYGTPPTVGENIIPLGNDGLTYHGKVSNAIGIYLYGDFLCHFNTSANVFYNESNVDFSDIEGYLSLKYGDAVRAKLGFSCDGLVITLPEGMDSGEDYYGSQVIPIDNGFYEDGLFEIEANINLPSSLPTDISLVKYLFEYDTVSNNSSTVILTPSEETLEPRYGDKVLLEKSYEGNDLKMYDVIDIIMKRFNLSIKDQIDSVLKFVKEPDFYTDDLIILDNRVSRRITKTYERNDIRNLSISNTEYGNINDRVDSLDDDNKILIYDIDKFVIDKSKFEEFELKLDSSLQNNLVYGKKLTSDEVSTWDFLKLENNSALWNAGTNKRIDTDNLPITFGISERSTINSFRLPRAVYADENNYPNAKEGADGDIMVVEHTLFEGTTEFNQLNYEDDFNISDGKGGLNKSSTIYKNFEDYIKRNSADTVNIECSAYLTNEEILNIRKGYKIWLFGHLHKPINISDIEFEKEGSVCTILMTQEPEQVARITFDTTTETWDIDTITFDNY